jgi:hypothetical protein
MVPRLKNVSLDNPHAEAAIIPNLHEDNYHNLCTWPHIARFRSFNIPTQVPIRTGTIVVCLNFGSLVKIAEPLDLDCGDLEDWCTLAQEDKGKILANSWIRYFAASP